MPSICFDPDSLKLATSFQRAQGGSAAVPYQKGSTRFDENKVMLFAHSTDGGSKIVTPPDRTGKTPEEMAKIISEMYKGEKKKDFHCHLVVCEAGVEKGGKPSFAQLLAQELEKKGFKSPKVHAAASPPIYQNDGMTFEITNRGGFTVKNDKTGEKIIESGSKVEEYLNLPFNTFTSSGPLEYATLEQMRVRTARQEALSFLEEQKKTPKDIKGRTLTSSADKQKRIEYIERLEAGIKQNGSIEQALIDEGKMHKNPETSSFVNQVLSPLKAKMRVASAYSKSSDEYESQKAAIRKEINEVLASEVYQNKEDKQLSLFKEYISSSNTQDSSLNELKDLLDTVKEGEKALESSDVCALKSEIAAHETEAKKFFSVGHQAKADRLKQAMYHTPVLERSKLLERPGVKEELAQGRMRNVFGIQPSSEKMKEKADRVRKQEAYKAEVTAVRSRSSSPSNASQKLPPINPLNRGIKQQR